MKCPRCGESEPTVKDIDSDAYGSVPMTPAEWCALAPAERGRFTPEEVEVIQQAWLKEYVDAARAARRPKATDVAAA